MAAETPTAQWRPVEAVSRVGPSAADVGGGEKKGGVTSPACRAVGFALAHGIGAAIPPSILAEVEKLLHGVPGRPAGPVRERETERTDAAQSKMDPTATTKMPAAAALLESRRRKRSGGRRGSYTCSQRAPFRPRLRRLPPSLSPLVHARSPFLWLCGASTPPPLTRTPVGGAARPCKDFFIFSSLPPTQRKSRRAIQHAGLCRVCARVHESATQGAC